MGKSVLIPRILLFYDTLVKGIKSLVALDGDLRQIAHGLGYSNRDFKDLSLIKLSCSEPEAAERVEQAMELIENEWIYSKNLSTRRIFIEIRKSFIKTNR